jgi:ATP synthase protein I
MTGRSLSGTRSAPSRGRGAPGGRPGSGQPGNNQPGSGQPLEPGAVEDNQGWSIFSYLIAGMVAYGLLGWLVAWLTHVPVFLPVGALVGLFFAIGGVVWKYGRHP